MVEEEVPLPGKADLETPKKKAEAIVNEFKRFCKVLGGTLSGNSYTRTCILPTGNRVRVRAMKVPVLGPGDTIEKVYTDVVLEASLKDGREAWFHGESHTVMLRGVKLNVDRFHARYTEYWSPAFESAELEADDVTEITLRTYPVSNDIELIIVGKKSSEK